MKPLSISITFKFVLKSPDSYGYILVYPMTKLLSVTLLTSDGHHANRRIKASVPKVAPYLKSL